MHPECPNRLRYPLNLLLAHFGVDGQGEDLFLCLLALREIAWLVAQVLVDLLKM